MHTTAAAEVSAAIHIPDMSEKLSSSISFGPNDLAALLLGTTSSPIPTAIAGDGVDVAHSAGLCQLVRPLKRLRVQLKHVEASSAAARGIAAAGQHAAEKHHEPVAHSKGADDTTSGNEGQHIETHTAPSAAAQNGAPEQGAAVAPHARTQQPAEAVLPPAAPAAKGAGATAAAAGQHDEGAVGQKADTVPTSSGADTQVTTAAVLQQRSAAAGSSADRGRKLVLVPNQLSLPTHIKTGEGTTAGAQQRQQATKHGAADAHLQDRGTAAGKVAEASVSSTAAAAAAAGVAAAAAAAAGGGRGAADIMQHLLPQLSAAAEAAAEEALIAAAASAQDHAAATADTNAPQQDPTQSTQQVVATATDVCQLVQLFCPDVTAVVSLSPNTAGLTHNPAVAVDHPPDWQQDAGLVNPLQLLCLSGLRAACAQAGPRAVSRKLLAAADAAPPRPCRAEGGTGLLPWFWTAQQLLLQELGADVLAGKAAAKHTAGDKLIAAVRGRVRLAGLVTTAHRLLLHQVGHPHKELEPPVPAGQLGLGVGRSAAADQHNNREQLFQQQQQEWVDSDEEDGPSTPTISLAPLPLGPLAAAEATLQAVAAVIEEAAAAAAAAGWAPVLVDEPGQQQHGQPGKELVADAALGLGLVQLLCPATPAVLALCKDTAGPLCNPPVEADNPPRYQVQKGVSLEGPQLLTRSGLKVACMGILPNQLRVKLQQLAAAVATEPCEHGAAAAAAAAAVAAPAVAVAPAPALAAVADAVAAVGVRGAAAGDAPAAAAAAAAAGTATAGGGGCGHAEANQQADVPTPGLLPWFWSAHALAVSELHSPVWRAPNDDLPTGQRLVKVVRARVQLVRLLATAYNLLRQGGKLPLPKPLPQPASHSQAPSAATGGALAQGHVGPPAVGMPHWQQQQQQRQQQQWTVHQAAALTPHARAAAEAALASVAALLDHRAVAVRTAGWPGPSAAPGLVVAYQSDVFVADAAFAYGFVQLLCPAVCDVTALQWDTGQGAFLHNLAVELDEPPRWEVQVQAQVEGSTVRGHGDSSVPSDAAAAPEQQQQLQLQPAQLLTRSGLLAACSVVQPAALRDQLSELAVRTAPSYDGVDWGTGLLPWFWAAQQLLLTELRSYVWQRQGGSTSPGQCFQQAVQARVRLAGLVVEVYKLCKRGRLTAKQQKVALERLQQQQQQQQERERQGFGGGATHKRAGAVSSREPGGLPVAASPESVAAAVSGLRALIVSFASGLGLESGRGGSQASDDTADVVATTATAAAAAEVGGHHDGNSSEQPAAAADKTAGTAEGMLDRTIWQVLQQQQQQQDVWKGGSYRPLSPEAAAAADAALASAMAAAAAAAAAASKQHKPSGTPRSAVAGVVYSGSIMGEAVQEVQAVQAGQGGSRAACTGDAVQALQAAHSSSSAELTDATSALQMVLLFHPQLLSAPALQPDAEQQLTNLAVVRDEPAKYVWGWGEWYEELSQQQLCTMSGLKLACFGIQAEPLKHQLHDLTAAAATSSSTPAAVASTAAGGGRLDDLGSSNGGGSEGGWGLLPWFLCARDLLLQELHEGVFLNANQQMSAEQQLQQHIMARVQLTHVVFSAYSVLRQAALGRTDS